MLDPAPGVWHAFPAQMCSAVEEKTAVLLHSGVMISRICECSVVLCSGMMMIMRTYVNAQRSPIIL